MFEKMIWLVENTDWCQVFLLLTKIVSFTRSFDPCIILNWSNFYSATCWAISMFSPLQHFFLSLKNYHHNFIPAPFMWAILCFLRFYFIEIFFLMVCKDFINYHSASSFVIIICFILFLILSLLAVFMVRIQTKTT